MATIAELTALAEAMDQEFVNSRKAMSNPDGMEEGIKQFGLAIPDLQEALEVLRAIYFHRDVAPPHEYQHRAKVLLTKWGFTAL